MVDTKTPLRWPQWKAAFSANVGAAVGGMMMGWTTTVEDSLETKGYNDFTVTEGEFDWISGMLGLGAILGASIAGPLSDLFGRKKAIIASMIPCLFGEGFMIGAVNPAMLMVSRFLNGIGMGAISCVTPLYVDEIAHVPLRGALGSLFEIMFMGGLFISYVAGMMLSTFNFFLLCGVLPILLVILMASQPESPYYLVMKSKVKEARKSLRILRGNKFSIDGELQEITEILEQMEREKLSICEVFQTRTARVGLILSLWIVTMQQLSGIDAVTFFAIQIFADAGSDLDPQYCTVISGATCFIGTIFAGLLIDRWGRKILLLTSSSICSFCLCLLASYFLVRKYSPDLIASSSVSFLPLVTICVYFVAFTFGLGPVPWLIVPELVPPGARSPATSFCFAVSWFFTFIISTFFTPTIEAIGEGGAFMGLGVASAVGFFVLLVSLPETKGKTREEIQELLGS